MKKLSILAAMLLTLGFTSCVENDNPVDDGKTIITHDGVNYKTDLVATLTGEVGSEVSLTIGVYDNYDIYGVDFGDGNIVTDTVCYQNGGLKDENGFTVSWRPSATIFQGTIAGDGIVKVYGNSDVWYLVAAGGIAPTSLDQEKLIHAVQVSITGANVEEVVLPEMNELKQFSFNNSPVKSVDVSKAVNLTSLSINNTTVSKYAPQLEAIDLSSNVNLESLNIQGNQNANGKLQSLDLTNNTKLTGMGLYVQYNELTELKLGDNTLTTINVQNNKLTSLPTDKLSKLKNLYAADNEFTSIDVSNMENLAWFDVKNNKLEGNLDLTPNKKLTNVYVNNNELTGVKVDNVTKQFYFDNNNMIISTMPDLPAGMNTTSKKKQFHHSPQAGVVVVKVDFGVLDLSSEAKKKGIETEEVATTFKFFAGEKELVEGTDYTEKDGKFTFLHSYDKIYGVMTTAAYPGLEIKTTEFATKTYGTDVEQEPTVIFSWAEGTATGGTVVGNGADASRVTETLITVSSKKANIDTDNITITLSKALEAGDIIKITGYRKKDNDANGTLYFLFETGEVIDEGDVVKWNNIHENYGQEPNTNSYEVTEKAAGSKSIKIARSKSSTNVMIQKIEILRK